MEESLHQHSRPSRFATLPASLVLGALLITLLVLGLVSFAVDQSRRNSHQQAALQTENLSWMLQQVIASTIDQVDISLQAVVMEVERQGAHGGISAPALNKFLAQQQSLQPDIASLRAIDANGVIMYGEGVPHRPGISVADRDYFIRARDDPKADLVIEGPIFARLSQKHLIVFARRLNMPDGSFAGVVYANITTEHFQKMLTSPDLGIHGAATLRTLDLRLVARHSTVPNAADIGSQTVSPQLLEQLKTNPEHGSYVARTSVDNIERSNVYRRITPYPFYLIVGLATEDYLGGWRPA